MRVFLSLICCQIESQDHASMEMSQDLMSSPLQLERPMDCKVLLGIIANTREQFTILCLRIQPQVGSPIQLAPPKAPALRKRINIEAVLTSGCSGLRASS